MRLTFGDSSFWTSGDMYSSGEEAMIARYGDELRSDLSLIHILSSLAVYLFVSIYNAYFWPLLVTTKSTMRTVQVGVAQLVAGDVVDYSQILASAMIAIIPTVVAYIFGQDYIIKGMTAGGVKG